MSSNVLKTKRHIAPESEEDDDEDGYVKIRYQQPGLSALEIPTDANGDLPWKLVRALDSKIIGLAIQSKEKRRIMKIKDGVYQEPKKGWKCFTIIALMEEPSEKETVSSTVSSRRDVFSVGSKVKVKTEKENVPAKDFAYSNNISTVLCKPSPKSILPELACIAKPVNCTSNKEHSVSENSFSVHATSDNDVGAADHRKLMDKGASNNENSNLENSSLFHHPSTFTNCRPVIYELYGAYNVESFHQLKKLFKNQPGFSNNIMEMAITCLRKALIVHADKNVISLLSSMYKNQNILYNQVDPSAPDVCKLCQQQSLTIGHLLKKEHLDKYYKKFHQESPEIDILLRPENHHFYFNASNNKLIVLSVCSTNKPDDETLEDAGNKEHPASKNSFSVHDSSITTDDWSIFDGLCAAYKVDALYELKELAKKQTKITTKFFDILCRFLRKALINHADKNVFSLLSSAEKSNILYNQIDPAAPDLCELCQKPLTIEHLLKKEHLKKYRLKFNQEIPEINNIVNYFYSDSVNKKLKGPTGFATNTCSNQGLFDKYKNAFVYRISEQNLIIPIEDPYFLDRFLFMRNNLKFHFVPGHLRPDTRSLFLQEKPLWTFQEIIYRILSIDHIRNALSQEDLDWICKILSFVHDNEDGYWINLPSRKRKADETREDTVITKRSKMF